MSIRRGADAGVSDLEPARDLTHALDHAMRPHAPLSLRGALERFAAQELGHQKGYARVTVDASVERAHDVRPLESFAFVHRELEALHGDGRRQEARRECFDGDFVAV